jgi:hypothetical protein
LFYVFKGCFRGVDEEFSCSKTTRISEPFSSSDGVVHIHIIRWWIFLDDKSKIFYYPGFFAVLSVGSMNCRTSSGLESNFSGNAVTRALRWAARSSAFRVLLKVLVLKGRRREEDIVEDGKIS